MFTPLGIIGVRVTQLKGGPQLVVRPAAGLDIIQRGLRSNSNAVALYLLMADAQEITRND